MYPPRKKLSTIDLVKTAQIFIHELEKLDYLIQPFEDLRDILSEAIDEIDEAQTELEDALEEHDGVKDARDALRLCHAQLAAALDNASAIRDTIPYDLSPKPHPKTPEA